MRDGYVYFPGPDARDGYIYLAGHRVRDGYVYIAGPYGDSRGYHEVERNISKARETAAFLATNRVPFFCPHLNSAHFEVIVPDVPSEFWHDLDIRILKYASAVLLLEFWEYSLGSTKEVEVAEKLNIPVFLPEGRHQLVDWWGFK